MFWLQRDIYHDSWKRNTFSLSNVFIASAGMIINMQSITIIIHIALGTGKR